jgi:hypothetical protein
MALPLFACSPVFSPAPILNARFAGNKGGGLRVSPARPAGSVLRQRLQQKTRHPAGFLFVRSQGFSP